MVGARWFQLRCAFHNEHASCWQRGRARGRCTATEGPTRPSHGRCLLQAAWCCQCALASACCKLELSSALLNRSRRALTLPAKPAFAPFFAPFFAPARVQTSLLSVFLVSVAKAAPFNLNPRTDREPRPLPQNASRHPLSPCALSERVSANVHATQQKGACTNGWERL